MTTPMAAPIDYDPIEEIERICVEFEGRRVTPASRHDEMVRCLTCVLQQHFGVFTHFAPFRGLYGDETGGGYTCFYEPLPFKPYGTREDFEPPFHGKCYLRKGEDGSGQHYDCRLLSLQLQETPALRHIWDRIMPVMEWNPYPHRAGMLEIIPWLCHKECVRLEPILEVIRHNPRTLRMCPQGEEEGVTFLERLHDAFAEALRLLHGVLCILHPVLALQHPDYIITPQNPPPPLDTTTVHYMEEDLGDALMSLREAQRLKSGLKEWALCLDLGGTSALNALDDRITSDFALKMMEDLALPPEHQTALLDLFDAECRRLIPSAYVDTPLAWANMHMGSITMNACLQDWREDFRPAGRERLYLERCHLDVLNMADALGIDLDAMSGPMPRKAEYSKAE